MIKILFKSLVGGFLITVLLTVISAFVNAYTFPKGMSDSEVYARHLYFSMLLWFGVAAGAMLKNLSKIKFNISSLILRQALLWGPISVAWFFTTKGYDGVLVIGMIVSSAVLCYEMQAWSQAESGR